MKKGRMMLYSISIALLYVILYLEPEEHEAICLSLGCSADMLLAFSQLGMLEPKKRDGPES